MSPGTLGDAEQLHGAERGEQQGMLHALSPASADEETQRLSPHKGDSERSKQERKREGQAHSSFSDDPKKREAHLHAQHCSYSCKKLILPEMLEEREMRDLTLQKKTSLLISTHTLPPQLNTDLPTHSAFTFTPNLQP